MLFELIRDLDHPFRDRIPKGRLTLPDFHFDPLRAGQGDRLMLGLGPRAGVWTRIAGWGPGMDHPVWPGHREGEYLRVRVYQRR